MAQKYTTGVHLLVFSVKMIATNYVNEKYGLLPQDNSIASRPKGYNGRHH